VGYDSTWSAVYGWALGEVDGFSKRQIGRLAIESVFPAGEGVAATGLSSLNGVSPLILTL
jgi:hypothetical protein